MAYDKHIIAEHCSYYSTKLHCEHYTIGKIQTEWFRKLDANAKLLHCESKERAWQRKNLFRGTRVIDANLCNLSGRRDEIVSPLKVDISPAIHALLLIVSIATKVASIIFSIIPFGLFFTLSTCLSPSCPVVVSVDG